MNEQTKPQLKTNEQITEQTNQQDKQTDELTNNQTSLIECILSPSNSGQSLSKSDQSTYSSVTI